MIPPTAKAAKRAVQGHIIEWVNCGGMLRRRVFGVAAHKTCTQTAAGNQPPCRDQTGVCMGCTA
eukprot:678982-Prymnesium_polylepis.4